MSLVMTPRLNSSRSHSHRRRTSMVLPEPTGPPIPMRKMRFFEGVAVALRATELVSVESGDEEALISYFMLHGGDFHQRIKPAQFVATDGQGKSHFFLHARKRSGQHALGGILSDAQEFRGGQADGAETLKSPRRQQRLLRKGGQTHPVDDGVMSLGATFLHGARKSGQDRGCARLAKSVKSPTPRGAACFATFARGFGRIHAGIQREQGAFIT